jgi:bisphosphoglycerate-independent phosphoglycerate mutase (AlkP superfamily)
MNKPIVLVIMDGVGKGDGGAGDAVAVAKCPHLYRRFSILNVGLEEAV